MGNKKFNNSACKGESNGYNCDNCPFWDNCDYDESNINLNEDNIYDDDLK